MSQRPNLEPDVATVVYEPLREHTTVMLVGEFDLVNLDVLVDAMRAAAALSDHVVVDLERVTFLGIRSLMSMIDAANEGAAELILRRPSRTIERLLRLMLDREPATVFVESTVPDLPT